LKALTATIIIALFASVSLLSPITIPNSAQLIPTNTKPSIPEFTTINNHSAQGVENQNTQTANNPPPNGAEAATVVVAIAGLSVAAFIFMHKKSVPHLGSLK
jgi:hypothetical protein